MTAFDSGTSSKIAAFGFVCAFFVVAIHVPQPVPSDASQPAWWLYRLTAGTFGRIAVPFYFAVAGYFLARHFGEGSWWRRETSKRLKSLVVPFVLWLLLWDAAEGVLAVASNVRDGVAATAGFPSGRALLARVGVDPFGAPSNVPLWFVRSLFLFVAASGVLLPALKRLGVAFPAVVLAMSAASRFSDGSSALREMLVHFVSLQGLFYFLVGSSLAMGVVRMSARSRLFAALGAVGVAGLFASQFAAARGVAWWGVLHELSLPFALLAAWRLFPCVSWPRSLTSLTFPIYILHVFVIRALDVAMYGKLSCAWLAFKFAVVCAATLAAAAASRALAPRLHCFAFGGR